MTDLPTGRKSRTIALPASYLRWPDGRASTSYSARSLAERGRLTRPFSWRSDQYVVTAVFGEHAEGYRLDPVSGPGLTYEQRVDERQGRPGDSFYLGIVGLWNGQHFKLSEHVTFARLPDVPAIAGEQLHLL